MKLKTIALLVIIAFLAVLAVMFIKKQFQVRFDTMGNRIITDSEIKAAFEKASEKYGVEFARKLEQLFRKETAHFKSKQFKVSLSPGMEISGGTNSTKTTFPFGWSSLKKFIDANPKYNGQFYVARFNENGTGIPKTFVGFPTIESSVMFTAYMIHTVRGGRFGYWRTTQDEALALSYESQMQTIKPRFV